MSLTWLSPGQRKVEEKEGETVEGRGEEGGLLPRRGSPLSGNGDGTLLKICLVSG